MRANHRALPSRKIARAFRALKNSIVWNTMSFKEKHEIKFNHRLELKAQLNKEFYAKHYEFTLKELEGDTITDADILEIRRIESEIADQVARAMSIPLIPRTSKPKAKKNDGNMNYLFA